MDDQAQQTIEAVLDFWLGELDNAGLASKETSERWWKKDASLDAEIHRRFAEVHAEVLRGAHEGWLETPRGAVAYVVVLDQFSRNMFRDTARMYAGDDRALRAASQAIARGFDRELPTDARVFLYMPFMHCEQLATQDRCIELFTRFADECTSEASQKRVRTNLEYARQHRDIVSRFGRFPHRNARLSRETTSEEAAFLKEPGSSF